MCGRQILCYAVLLCIMVIRNCNAKPDGAPSEACVTMSPNHTDEGTLNFIEPQTGPFPYILSSASYYITYGYIEVNITAKEDDYFRGFLLQMRDANENIVGAFVGNRQPNDAKGLECTQGTSAMTHSNANDTKTHVSFVWLDINALATGDLKVVATVAREYNEFCVEHKAAVQRITPPDRPDLKQCGQSLGCYTRGLTNCTIADCDYVAVWRVNGNNAEIYLTGETEGWIAIGFSTDVNMGEDDVYSCLYNADVIEARRYKNPGGHSAAQLQGPITDFDGKVSNGRIECWIRRSLAGSGDQVALNENYYHLYGLGSVRSPNGAIRKHGKNPAVSAAMRDLTEQTYEAVVHAVQVEECNGSGRLVSSVGLLFLSFLAYCLI